MKTLYVTDLDGTLLNRESQISEYSLNAINGLIRKELWKYDKVLPFGDAINDISMFKISDECYAVENAVEELKEEATGIIDTSNNDGVVRWLEKNVVV